MYFSSCLRRNGIASFVALVMKCESEIKEGTRKCFGFGDFLFCFVFCFGFLSDELSGRKTGRDGFFCSV